MLKQSRLISSITFKADPAGDPNQATVRFVIDANGNIQPQGGLTVREALQKYIRDVETEVVVQSYDLLPIGLMVARSLLAYEIKALRRRAAH